MNTLPLVLDLLLVQGLLGAFDTVFHHELRVALPQQHNSALELRIHAVRAVLYGVVFAGLAWFVWGGVWLLILCGIVLIEVLLTLWDFVVEDRTRLLPASERITHTVLAINGGALFGILCLQFPSWWSLPNELRFVSHGWPSAALTVLALGVVASGLRDAVGSVRVARRESVQTTFYFGAAPQTVLITGGTGFIGQVLVRSLLAAGHAPVLLTRSPLKAAYLFHGRVRCISSLEDLHPEMNVDVVINLAGERILGPRWTTQRKTTLLASRVNTTEAVVRWVARATQRPRLMLSASAVGYYGIQSANDPRAWNEQAAPQPVFGSELCQRWEAAAHAIESHDVPLAILRFGLVLGAQGALPAMRLPFLFGAGGPVGDGRQILSWVHIDDLLGAIAHLMAQPDARAVAGVYNITAPQPVPNRVFATTLGRVLHRPAGLAMPAALFRLLLGEQATLLVDGARVVPEHLLASGYRFRFPDIESALKQLHGRSHDDGCMLHALQ